MEVHQESGSRAAEMEGGFIGIAGRRNRSGFARVTRFLALAGLLLGLLGASIVHAPNAAATGCGHSDHTEVYPLYVETHVYLQHYDAANAHWHEWLVLGIGGYRTDTWCGCIGPGPCAQGGIEYPFGGLTIE